VNRVVTNFIAACKGDEIGDGPLDTPSAGRSEPYETVSAARSASAIGDPGEAAQPGSLCSLQLELRAIIEVRCDST
jgi:hypothetical protein